LKLSNAFNSHYKSHKQCILSQFLQHHCYVCFPKNLTPFVILNKSSTQSLCDICQCQCIYYICMSKCLCICIHRPSHSGNFIYCQNMKYHKRRKSFTYIFTLKLPRVGLSRLQNIRSRVRIPPGCM
jgi:hypothetical protein